MTLARNKANGAKAEIDWTNHLNALGYNAVRQVQTGRRDEGDVLELHRNGTVFVWQVKYAGDRIVIPAWLRGLETQIANVRRKRPGVPVTGAVVVRPKGVPNPEKWWVIQRAGSVRGRQT